MTNWQHMMAGKLAEWGVALMDQDASDYDPLTLQAVTTAAGLTGEFDLADIPKPLFMTRTADGGISFRWGTANERNFTLNVHPDGSAEWFAFVDCQIIKRRGIGRSFSGLSGLIRQIKAMK